MRSVILSLGTIWEDVWITYIHWDILSRKKPRQHRYEIYWRVHETGKNYRNSSLLISGPSLENVSNINLKFSISTHESRLKNWEFASISRWSAQHGRWYWISESQFSGLIGEWVDISSAANTKTADYATKKKTFKWTSLGELNVMQTKSTVLFRYQFQSELTLTSQYNDFGFDTLHDAATLDNDTI